MNTSSLKLLNGTMAVLHLAQAILVMLLASSFAVPLTTTFLVFDEAAGKLVPQMEDAGDISVAPLIAAFLIVSSVAHLTTIVPGIHQWYLRNLEQGINYLRWYEYSISASIMIVVIAMLVGVYDISTLFLLFTVNAAMIFFGLMMELHNQTTGRTNWTSFVIGCLIGAAPWVVISLYLFAPATRSISDVPAFVYGIYVSLFIWFNLFAVNMFLQYRKVGPWRDYLFGEKAYILLSLTAKSALAWQVFGGTLRDV